MNHIMTYKPKHIAAIIVPKQAFNKDFRLDHLAQATTLMTSHSNGLEEGRLTAQLAYISAKLGDLPVLTFDGTQFDAFSASQDQWTSILNNIDANADNPLISELLEDESNDLYTKATGLQSAVMGVNGLEKPIDIHEFKEIGGAWTSLPINIGLYLTGKSN